MRDVRKVATASFNRSTHSVNHNFAIAIANAKRQDQSTKQTSKWHFINQPTKQPAIRSSRPHNILITNVRVLYVFWLLQSTERLPIYACCVALSCFCFSMVAKKGNVMSVLHTQDMKSGNWKLQTFIPAAPGLLAVHVDKKSSSSCSISVDNDGANVFLSKMNWKNVPFNKLKTTVKYSWYQLVTDIFFLKVYIIFCIVLILTGNFREENNDGTIGSVCELTLIPNAQYITKFIKYKNRLICGVGHWKLLSNSST